MSFLFSRLLAACVVALVPGFTATARAATPAAPVTAAGGVLVHEAWARASPGAVPTGAAYVTLMGGDQPDTLIGASTPIAATAEAHETINDNGIMKMRSVAAVPIPPHQMVTFSPGGYHIMLTGLKQPLIAGRSFPLTLVFAHTAPLTVDVQVRGLGRETTGSMDEHMGGHDAMPMH